MFVKKVEQFILQNQLFKQNDLLLLAVSGGRDSIVMLDILNRLNYSIVVAHCNFKLREKESDDEAFFVENLCKKLNIPFFVKIFNTKDLAKKSKESIQVSARNLRYQWFNELANQIEAKKIVTAHHLDDQIETFLINFSRGTGIKGLSGIPIKRDKIVRPLLSVNRDEINLYVHENKLEFREDSSNADDKYLRNKIRLNFTPLLKELNPSFYTNFYNTINHLKNVENYWKNGYLQWKSKNIFEKEKDVYILKNSNEDGFLEQFLAENHFSNSAIKNIISKKEIAVGKMFFTDSYQLLSDRKHWILTPKIIQEKRIYQISDADIPIVLKVNQIKINETPLFSDDKIYIDADKVNGNLQLRNWQNGDYFFPFGMTGKKKLSDFFTDQKINSADKAKIWLLCDEKNIIWLIGLRMDNRYRITPKTKSVIAIHLQ